ncbi:MAG: hypothetical protein HYY46_04685 [Deltaproteobacteria bacterium]|nr:hypothetical protein [Deltaproteobacteria bacterium]
MDKRRVWLFSVPLLWLLCVTGTVPGATPEKDEPKREAVVVERLQRSQSVGQRLFQKTRKDAMAL